MQEEMTDFAGKTRGDRILWAEAWALRAATFRRVGRTLQADFNLSWLPALVRQPVLRLDGSLQEDEHDTRFAPEAT